MAFIHLQDKFLHVRRIPPPQRHGDTEVDSVVVVESIIIVNKV